MASLYRSCDYEALVVVGNVHRKLVCLKSTMLNYCNIAKQCMVVDIGLVAIPWSHLSSVALPHIAYLPSVEKVTVFVTASTALGNIRDNLNIYSKLRLGRIKASEVVCGLAIKVHSPNYDNMTLEVILMCMMNHSFQLRGLVSDSP